MQHNINHCEAAHDLLTQSVREKYIDMAIIADPYRRLNTQIWVTDATEKTVIWSSGNRSFEEEPNVTQKGCVRANLGKVYFYSAYAPPSLNM